MRGRCISEYVDRHVFAPGATDAHGNPAESWATVETLGIYAFNPGTTTEPFIPGHDRVITKPAIYAPTGTVLDPRDRVGVRGVLYEVDGVVKDFRNPFDSSLDGVQVELKEVRG